MRYRTTITRLENIMWQIHNSYPGLAFSCKKKKKKKWKKENRQNAKSENLSVFPTKVWENEIKNSSHDNTKTKMKHDP